MRHRGRIAAGLVSLAVTGCVVGTGGVATTERTIDEFDRIVLSTSGDVVVDVGQNGPLVIEAEDNVLSLLTSEVVDGVLVLDSDRPFTTSRGITYRVSTSSLAGVEVTGSGDVDATGVDSPAFEALVTGSGSVRSSGRCSALGVEISGSGSFDGGELACSAGQVVVAGSGGAVVNVSEALEATVTGSGSIEYLGDPEVDSSVTGSGSIERG